MLLACVLIGAAGVAPNMSDMTGQFFFLVFAIASLASAAGYLLSESLVNAVYLLQSPTIIRLTRGDEANMLSIQKRKTRSKGIIIFVAVTIVVGVLLNVFSNFLYEWLKT